MKNYIYLLLFVFTLSSCTSTLSPKIRLSGVPDNTVELNINMRDLDSPNYPHGGGVIAYTGDNSIKEGALEKFKGPCHPERIVMS